MQNLNEVNFLITHNKFYNILLGYELFNFFKKL